LSWAIDSLTALVASTSAAQMRRCLTPPAELHQRTLREATVGHATRQRGVDDAARGGAQAHVLVDLAQLADHGLLIPVDALLQRSAHQLLGFLDGQAPDVFLAVLDDDLEVPRRAGAVRVAVGDRTTGLRLQRQRRLLDHMGQADGHALGRGRAQCADLGEERAQPVFEPAQQMDVVLVGRADDHGLDGGVAAPEVGTAQGAKALDFHGRA
jgi:hypothetical protein